MASAAPKLDVVTIGEAARRVGLTPRAIRYYERFGLVAIASRGDSNYRVYDAAALRELRAIARCRTIGLSLAGIRDLRSASGRRGPQSEETDLLREQLKHTEARIRDLLAVRRELRRQLGLSGGETKPGTALHPPAHAKSFGARR